MHIFGRSNKKYLHIFGQLKFQEIHIFGQEYFQGNLTKKRYKIHGILLDIRTLMYSHSPTTTRQ